MSTDRDLPAADEWRRGIEEAKEHLQHLLDNSAAARAVGHHVAGLLRDYGCVHLERDDEGYVRVMWIDARNGLRHSAQGNDLLDALAAVLGEEEPRKRCARCRLFKVMTDFSLMKRGPADGHNYYCKECERKRVAEYWEKTGSARDRERRRAAGHVAAHPSGEL
jgi:hypothetical protein